MTDTKLEMLDAFAARLRAVEAERDRLREAIKHVVNDSPGTPDSVKKYLLRALEGSWGEPYEQAMTHSRPERGGDG